MGKGSKRRHQEIPETALESNWRRTFGLGLVADVLDQPLPRRFGDGVSSEPPSDLPPVPQDDFAGKGGMGQPGLGDGGEDQLAVSHDGIMSPR